MPLAPADSLVWLEVAMAPDLPPGMEDQHYDMARDIGQLVESMILDVTETAGCHRP